MNKKQKEQQSAFEKKQWVKPEVEIISSGNIANGTVFNNSEGAWVKYYNGSHITKAVYFS